MSTWETSRSSTPGSNPGPRMISITPMPRSVSVPLAPGKAGDQVVVVVGEPVAAVGEAEHAVAMAVLAGQQRGAAGRAHGGGTERLPEQHTLVRQALEVRRRDLVSVRLDMASRVMRVE